MVEELTTKALTPGDAFALKDISHSFLAPKILVDPVEDHSAKKEICLLDCDRVTLGVCPLFSIASSPDEMNEPTMDSDYEFGQIKYPLLSADKPGPRRSEWGRKRQPPSPCIGPPLKTQWGAPRLHPGDQQPLTEAANEPEQQLPPRQNFDQKPRAVGNERAGQQLVPQEQRQKDVRQQALIFKVKGEYYHGPATREDPKTRVLCTMQPDSEFKKTFIVKANDILRRETDPNTGYSCNPHDFRDRLARITEYVEPHFVPWLKEKEENKREREKLNRMYGSDSEESNSDTDDFNSDTYEEEDDDESEHFQKKAHKLMSKKLGPFLRNLPYHAKTIKPHHRSIANSPNSTFSPEKYHCPCCSFEDTKDWQEECEVTFVRKCKATPFVDFNGLMTHLHAKGEAGARGACKYHWAAFLYFQGMYLVNP